MTNRKRKSKIRNVIIHTVTVDNYNRIPGEVAKLHVSVVERRLKESGLNSEQKILVIDMITEMLKSQVAT